MALPEHVQKKRDELVASVIKDIQEGKPFFWNSGHFGKRPRNLLLSTKGKDQFYRGINSVGLDLAAKAHGFTDSRWGTYEQAILAGGNVKKGEHGTPIEYWQYTKDLLEKNPSTGKMEPVYRTNQDTGQIEKVQVTLERPIVRTYFVFNASQMEGIPPEHEITIDENDRSEYMENMIKNSESKIFFDQTSENYYSPPLDEIHVMDRKDFKTLDAFYATLAHEIAHSTGAEHRLNRTTLQNHDGFGGENYAKEELRAELASMFIQQEYGVKFDESHYRNHVAYLQSWAEVLKKDPNELFRAASDAEKAAEYIKAHMLELGMEKIRDRQEAQGVAINQEALKQMEERRMNRKPYPTKEKSRYRSKSYVPRKSAPSPKERLKEEMSKKQGMSRGLKL